MNTDELFRIQNNPTSTVVKQRSECRSHTHNRIEKKNSLRSTTRENKTLIPFSVSTQSYRTGIPCTSTRITTPVSTNTSHFMLNAL